MSDQTPKPKLKRWRRIIAGVLLFVVAVAGWWYCPRGDQRFVGKWRTINSVGITTVMTLYSNGVGRGDGLIYHTRFFWRVADNKLYEGSSLGDPVVPVAAWLSQRIAKVTGIHLCYSQDVCPVVEVSADRLVLLPDESVGIEAAQVWTRIPE